MRAGRRVTLSPRAFDLLEVLLERRPEVVPQSELRDRLWPETFVAYSSLARLVTEARKAIGDASRKPRLVRTVYGRGYAFSGEAVDEVSGCTLVWADRLIPLVEGENVIGRGDDCHVRIQSTKVSRRHARDPGRGRAGHPRGPGQQERDLRRLAGDQVADPPRRGRRDPRGSRGPALPGARGPRPDRDRVAAAAPRVPARLTRSGCSSSRGRGRSRSSSRWQTSDRGPRGGS